MRFDAKKQTLRLWALALLLAYIIYAIPASAAEESAAETEQRPLTSEAFYILDAMGFLGEEIAESDAEGEFSRAQFAGTLFHIAGYQTAEYKNAEIPFIDVNAETPWKNEICALYSMGIVDGNGKGTFSPDAAITYEQAVKLAVTVLGYREYTEAEYGGGMTGYVNMAALLKLNRGITIEVCDAPLTAEGAIQLLYNTGRTEVMEPTKYTESGASYEIRKGEELFQKYNKIYYGRGIVQSDGIVSLTNEEAAEGAAVIDEEIYRLSEYEISDYLGCRVRFFYREESEIKTILWAEGDAYNNVVLISAADLLTDDSRYSLTNIVYANGEKTAELKIDEYADIVWNNTIRYDKDIKPKSGSIKLIDNNGDRHYDVVIVREFENLYVKNVSLNGNFIAGKYDSSLLLDDFENIIITENNQRISLDELSNKRVISYIASADKKHLRIYVNPAGTADVLQSVSSRNGETICRFSDTDYKMAYNYKALSDSGYHTEILEPGMTYNYYLDSDGNIAEIEMRDNDLQYALIIDTTKDDNAFADENSVLFRLLLESGDKITANSADKVKINGVIEHGHKWSNDFRLISADTGETIQQLVKVAFDADGRIRELEFAADAIDSKYGYDANRFSLDAYKNGGAVYSKNMNVHMLNSKYHIYEDTLIFAKLNGINQNEPYFIINRKDLEAISRYSLYDCDSTMSPTAVFAEISYSSNSYGSDIVLVDSISEVLDSDGEVYTMITGWRAGLDWSGMEISEGIIGDDIKRGDVLKVVEISAKRRVAGITKVISLRDPADKKIRMSTSRSWNWEIFAPVYAVGSNGIVTVSPEGEGRTWNGALTATPYGSYGTGGQYEYIPVYDTRTDSIYLGEKSKLAQSRIPYADGSAFPIDEYHVWVYLCCQDEHLRDMIIVYY